VPRPSIYQAAGGERAFRALAAAHHARCLADPVLEHPFSHGVRDDHVERLAAYWAEVLGGPARYTARYGGHVGMIGVHAGQGMEEELGQRFAACFVAAVDDAGMPDDAELRDALRAYITWATGEVQTYSPPGSVVPTSLPMPQWSWHGPVGG
jgi:hemoglobin